MTKKLGANYTIILSVNLLIDIQKNERFSVDGVHVAIEADVVTLTCQEIIKAVGYIVVDICAKKVDFVVQNLWIKHKTITTGLANTNIISLLINGMSTGKLTIEN
ncbi:hypothetical protein KQ873_02865 [Mycoplasma zalophidermidis]|uniref:hypothetical protein n=1 Tax=Mycoplasma zalophidermidis TaxID=398174 RepID=UPI001C0FD345|nr:hypothetical protein [Mycoplasma zalophidermidis]MBU4689965.1 hypothetical protein [Mycoplasma zalophidermidis]